MLQCIEFHLSRTTVLSIASKDGHHCGLLTFKQTKKIKTKTKTGGYINFQLLSCADELGTYKVVWHR